MFQEYIPTFYYFDHFVNWNKDFKILDFGSNSGNLLRSNPGIIDHNRYTGIDIDHEAIIEGQQMFPNANWCSYNRHNPVYNFSGDNSLPDLKDNYDLILSYSVFSHTSLEDMLELVDYLYSLLNANGKLYFSFCNINNKNCVEWFRNRRIDCDEIPYSNLIYLVNNKISYNFPKVQCEHFVAFYDPDYLCDKLKKFQPKINPAPNDWIQDCVEISKS